MLGVAELPSVLGDEGMTLSRASRKTTSRGRVRVTTEFGHARQVKKGRRAGSPAASANGLAWKSVHEQVGVSSWHGEDEVQRHHGNTSLEATGFGSRRAWRSRPRSGCAPRRWLERGRARPAGPDNRLCGDVGSTAVAVAVDILTDRVAVLAGTLVEDLFWTAAADAGRH